MSTAITTTTTRQLTRPEDVLVAPLKDNTRRIASLLGCREDETKQIQASVLLAVAESPYLLKVANTPVGQATLILSVLRGARMGIRSFSGPFAHGYLVPFGEKITLIPAYKGMVAMAYGCGAVKLLKAEAIRDGDEFDYSDGSKSFLHHKKDLRRTRGDIYAAYCFTVLPSGEQSFTVLPYEDVVAVREMALVKLDDKGKNSSPWMVWPDPMWAKTAIRRHVNQLPIDPDKHVNLIAMMELDDRAAQGLLSREDEDTAMDVSRQLEPANPTPTATPAGRLASQGGPPETGTTKPEKPTGVVKNSTSTSTAPPPENAPDLPAPKPLLARCKAWNYKDIPGLIVEIYSLQDPDSVDACWRSLLHRAIGSWKDMKPTTQAGFTGLLAPHVQTIRETLPDADELLNAIGIAPPAPVADDEDLDMPDPIQETVPEPGQATQKPLTVYERHTAAFGRVQSRPAMDAAMQALKADEKALTRDELSALRTGPVAEAKARVDLMP